MYFLSINRLNQGAMNAGLADRIQDHIAWTRKQIESGVMVQAGKWGESGGMAIVKATSLEEAESLMAGDPLAQSGLAVFETAQLYPDVPVE